jgi:pyruvate dehydrogenase E1 component alpha subunit
MDIFAVKDAVERAVARARKGSGPTLLETKTYRWFGHSISDQRIYRTKEEEAAWKERCPIVVLRNRLAGDGIMTESEMDAVRDTAAATIEQATQFAVDSPLPDPSELFDGVYARHIAAF